MFTASASFLFFDYFRVPYETTAEGNAWSTQLGAGHPLRSTGWLSGQGSDFSTRYLHWIPKGADSLGRNGRGPKARYLLGTIPIFGEVVGDVLLEELLDDTGAKWHRTAPIRNAAGQHVGSIWKDDDGSVFLPFDPDEIIRNFWSEAYKTMEPSTGPRLKHIAMRAYYRLRPAIPRSSQIWMRQLFSKVQARSRFPRWPVETALHDFYAHLFKTVAELVERPVPWIAPWPKQYSWALVLTHDVDTGEGFRNLNLLRQAEVKAGYRSSWYFVPRRYPFDQKIVRELTEEGFEVGVHGLYHDGRDFDSLRTLTDRLPAMNAYGRSWHARGFRSPSTHRVWEWMTLLDFDYDSSYPDTDPFEPQPGGCCTWLPYFNQDLVELPITLPQDHTLFVILRQPDESLWLEKTSYLKAHGGMAVLNTHPDYMLVDGRLEAYVRFLQVYAGEAEVWRALPYEVNDWWRRRAASCLELVSGEWRIIGPAAGEGAISFTTDTQASLTGVA